MKGDNFLKVNKYKMERRVFAYPAMWDKAKELAEKKYGIDSETLYTFMALHNQLIRDGYNFKQELEAKRNEGSDMYLLFDTETTGLPKNYNASAARVDNWPRMVQLAYILCDRAGNKIESGSVIIYPSDFEIPLAASKIHRITQERALEEGVDIETVLHDFLRVIREAEYVVAHNLSFDEKIIGSEYIRHNLPDPLTLKKKICTMKSTTDLCQIPGFKCGTFKWPKLAELHRALFGSDFEEAHDAAADIAATARCFFELKKRGYYNFN